MIALLMNDATVLFFDRMVPNISILVARKHGICPTIMKGRTVTVESMEHGVCMS